MPKPDDGFNCLGCGKHHEFGFYVAAHWYDIMTHTCDCGQRHTVHAGKVKRIENKRKKRREGEV